MVRIPSMKKLYITDLDGTLLNQNASISPYSEQVIKKIIKQGIHFTIATGRSPIRIFSILQNIKDGVPISDDMLLEYPHIYSAIKKKISVDDSSITLEVSEFSGILHIAKLFSESENEYSVTLLNDSSNLNLAIISPDNSIFHLPMNFENVSITLQSGTSYLVLFGHKGSGNLTVNTPSQISLSIL